MSSIIKWTKILKSSTQNLNIIVDPHRQFMLTCPKFAISDTPASNPPQELQDFLHRSVPFTNPLIHITGLGKSNLIFCADRNGNFPDYVLHTSASCQSRS